jgi:hypothetical protein
MCRRAFPQRKSSSDILKRKWTHPYPDSSIAELDTPDPGKKFYGIPYRLPQGVPSIYKPLIAYTTFCQTNQGLRLFMTRDAIDKDGNIRATGESSPNVSSKPYYENFFRAMGLSLSSCRSIQLTSNT